MRRQLCLLMVAALGLASGVQAVPLARAGASASAPLTTTALPTRSNVVRTAESVVQQYYATGGGATSDAGWRWAPFFMGVEALSRETGNSLYRGWLQAWGDRNAWSPTAPASPTANPDSRAAVQPWQDSTSDGVLADLAPSDRTMAANLAAPTNTYWWIDSLFMGLPLWTRWSARTGDPAYAAKGATFYTFLKKQGSTPYRTGCGNSGLFDPSEHLWWRDCMFVAQHDALGHKVFWARGNGWVMAALARTLTSTPPADPQYAEYRSMLQAMAARLAPLQGADGAWRSSLLSPSLYPAPETSGTALFTYAMANGIRTGILDRATYLPVVQRAWAALSANVKLGALSNCQGVGDSPANPTTSTPPAYCVGAFALAASELAQLLGPGGAVAIDSFTRSTSGLGTAEKGGAWTTSAPSTDFVVSTGTARLTTPAGGTRVAMLAGLRAPAADTTVTASFAPPRSGSTYVGLLGRTVGSASYGLRVVVSASGVLRVQVQRSGVTLRSVDLPGWSYRSGQRLGIRVRTTGSSPTTVTGKVWIGTTEPSAWQVSVTDSISGLQSPGGVGLSTYFSAGGSPGAVGVAFDDLLAVTPS